ncbi:MAG: peptidylprolyl isomerase [Chitinophagaceae bacterium]
MRKIFSYLALLFISFSVYTGNSQTKKTVVKKAIAPIQKDTVNSAVEPLIQITTPFGVMIAKLYNQTPLHKNNFLQLVKSGTYDSLLFHRAIPSFVIQGGDPESKNAPENKQLGAGALPGERIPAEIKPNFIHKRGALAAARDGNPEKASSNCQFYIVHGRKIDSVQLQATFKNSVQQVNPNFTYTKSQREIYERVGGTPELDQNYTVFGEIISGLEVIDAITAIRTKKGDRLLTNIWMKMRILP